METKFSMQQNGSTEKSYRNVALFCFYAPILFFSCEIVAKPYISILLSLLMKTTPQRFWKKKIERFNIHEYCINLQSSIIFNYIYIDTLICSIKDIHSSKSPYYSNDTELVRKHTQLWINKIALPPNIYLQLCPYFLFAFSRLNNQKFYHLRKFILQQTPWKNLWFLIIFQLFCRKNNFYAYICRWQEKVRHCQFEKCVFTFAPLSFNIC